jgi:hypothetical protein
MAETTHQAKLVLKIDSSGPALHTAVGVDRVALLRATICDDL